MTRFIILLPTIRDNIGFVFSHLFDSFTHPTDVYVQRDLMGQGEGHLQALNYAVANVVDPERHTMAVKMDDDVLLHPGWQDDVLQAFADIPTLGVCGIDLSHTEVGKQYMLGGMSNRQMYPTETVGKTRFIDVPHGNVGGMVMATPAALMCEIGDIPIAGDNKYPFYADGWYNHACRKRGYRTGYVVSDSQPTAIAHDDPQNYIDAKEADTERIRDEALRLFR